MIDRLGQALADWLVPVNAWTAGLLACAWLLDRALARRTRASLRMALYAPIALRILLPLSWTIHGAHVARLAVLLPLQALTAHAASDVPTAHPWRAAAGLVYLAVALVLALRAIVQRRRLARALVSTRPVAGIEAPCPVVCHDELGPMVVGVVAPRIVLPQGLVDGADEGALDSISKHEVAHVRRGDPWLCAAMGVLVIVAWPVVPLWLAVARVRCLIELACDEAALANADAAERRRYGHVLLDFAESYPTSLSGAGSLHFGSTLRSRIEAIALQRAWPRGVQATLIAAAVAAFAACSSAGPGAIPQATGSPRAKESGTLDEYGYQFADNPAVPSSRATSAPSAPPVDGEVVGRLPPEVIQGVVRQNFGIFRTCYESALARKPGLQGTVTVGYVIEPSGRVRDAADNGSSTLADADAVQCIVKGFGALAYPPPKGGYVTVVYPIVFNPGD